MNGQPVFSILRIRRDQAFGPHLDAYCANRGKGYGVHWMFVYRYHAPTKQDRSQLMQISLTWDMTPNNVKDNEVPGMAMQNLDTIYVMQAKPLASAETDRELNKGGAVQSPGPQVTHEIADIVNGETNFYQNPDVSRQWYQAIEHDSNRLRAEHGRIKTALIKAQQLVHAKENLIVLQNKTINDLTFYSRQLGDRMPLPRPDPAARIPGPSNAQVAPVSRIERQHPGAPQKQPIQQRIKPDPSAFVAKCEAVRDSAIQAPQHLEPLQFPRFGEFAVADDARQPHGNASYNVQTQQYGPVYDAADKVAAEEGTDEMEE